MLKVLPEKKLGTGLPPDRLLDGRYPSAGATELNLRSGPPSYPGVIYDVNEFRPLIFQPNGRL